MKTSLYRAVLANTVASSGMRIVKPKFKLNFFFFFFVAEACGL